MIIKSKGKEIPNTLIINLILSWNKFLKASLNITKTSKNYFIKKINIIFSQPALPF